MDFSIQIGNKTKTFDQYHQLLSFLDQQLAQWNNFSSEEPLYIAIKKVENDTETLSVQTSEKVDIKAIFGRP